VKDLQKKLGLLVVLYFNHKDTPSFSTEQMFYCLDRKLLTVLIKVWFMSNSISGSCVAAIIRKTTVSRSLEFLKLKHCPMEKGWCLSQHGIILLLWSAMDFSVEEYKNCIRNKVYPKIF